jgi:AraC-type DNA-binding domain-containing proteins
MLTDFNRSLELLDNLESDYLKLLYYDLAPMECDYKSYENSRLCTILEGYKNVSVNNGESFVYRPGQFVLMPSHSSIHMKIDVPTKALVFELNEDLLKSVTGKVSVDINADYDPLNEDRVIRGDTNEELSNCLNRLTSASKIIDKNKEFLIDLYAQELVYNLVHIKGVQQIIKMEHNNPIHRALKYIKENIRQPISISQLAYYLNMSETNFCNSFKKVMGVTPKEYITNLKMTLAKDMLKEQNVTEVAFDLGYENISHFIELFKNKYGITPKQFKCAGNTAAVKSSKAIKA